MARILYAVGGDGYGHATRAHSVAAGLLARGHDVRFITSHFGAKYLGEAFNGRVREVFGLCSVYHQGRVSVLGTVTDNLYRAWSQLSPTTRLIERIFREFRPDLIITDFEPFAAFLARRSHRPFISLANQHLLTHCDLSLPPGFHRDWLSAYLTIRLYYGGARRYLIPTFFPAPVRYQPACLVPPILRPQVYDKEPRDGDFLLAYKGAGGENDRFRDALEGWKRTDVRAYGFGPLGRRGRVEFRDFDAAAFLDDLAACAGVIGTAGHSLVCECIHFRKPMLLLPVHRQYEQILNGHHVVELGYGRSLMSLDAAAIDRFFEDMDRYRGVLARVKRTTMEPLLTKIEAELP